MANPALVEALAVEVEVGEHGAHGGHPGMAQVAEESAAEKHDPGHADHDAGTPHHASDASHHGADASHHGGDACMSTLSCSAGVWLQDGDRPRVAPGTLVATRWDDGDVAAQPPLPAEPPPPRRS